MISKKSFFNLIKICLRNNIWSIALTCIGLFISLPVYGSLYISTVKYRVMTGALKPEFAAAVFRRDVCGEQNILLLITVTIVAIISAIGGFSFLFSKQKVDLFHSIPEKRSSIFAANYAAGFIGFAIPYIGFMLLTLIIGSACGVVDGLGIKATLIMLLINMLGFVGVYAVVLLAVLLTGSVLVGVLASGVLLLYGPIMTIMFDELKAKFFLTYTSYSESAAVLNTSIAAMYYNLTEGMKGLYGRYNLSAGKFIIYILVTILIIALDYYVYNIRPSEAAHKAMAFKKTMPIIAVLLLIPAGVFCGIAFDAIASLSGTVNYGWLVFGALIAIAIGHFIIQAIYYSDFKSLFKNLYNPAIATVVVLLLFAAFAFDITGYDKYMPKGNQLESTAIVSGGLQQAIEYYDFDAESDEYGNFNYWVNSDEYRLNHMQITDAELVHDFVSAALVDSIELKNHQNERVFDNEFDKEFYDGKAYAYVTVRYNLKGNKKVYRSYTIDLLTHMDLYDRLYSNEDYKKAVYNVLTADESELTDVKLSTAIGTLPNKLTAEQSKKLVKTYREELLKQDAYDLQKGAPLGYLHTYHEVNENGYVNQYKTNVGYIYPSFTKTLKLLDEYGVDLQQYISADNVEYIKVSNHHYYENQEGPDKPDVIEYTNSDDIEKLFSLISPIEMNDIDMIINQYTDLDIEVKFKDNPGDYLYTIGYNMKEKDVPDYLRKAVNYYR